MQNKRSITRNTIWGMIIACFIIALIALVIGLNIYATALLREKVDFAFSLAKATSITATHATDTYSLTEQVMGIYRSLTPEERAAVGTEEYRAHFAEIDTELKAGGIYDVAFHAITNFKIGVDTIYIAMYDKDTCAMVYIVDPTEDVSDRLMPGDWESVTETGMMKFLNWDGTGMLYDIDHVEKYGWLCTAGYPMKKQGKTFAYLLVDVSIDGIIQEVAAYALQISLPLLIATILITWLVSRRMKKRVTEPIVAIAGAAQAYAQDKRDGVERSHFETLGINTNDEIEALSRTMAAMELDLAEHEQRLTQITAEKERINTELNMAQQIQASVLPNVFPAYPNRSEFDLYAFMKPAKEVGGDFYDFFMIDDDHLMLAIADVSGKGVPGALFMMIVKAILKNNAILGNSTAEILSAVNETICTNNRMQMFVTVWLGILEISTGKITAANAGHEYPAITRNGRFELLKDKHGFVIGGMEGMHYSEYELQLKPGDRLFVYTDGVPEATDSAQQLFGTKRMLDALNSNPNATPVKLLRLVREAVDTFVGGAEQFDDMTMLCLEYKGPGRSRA